MALHRGAARADLHPEANPLFGTANPAFGEQVQPPRTALANGPVPSDVAYQVIHDELLLDGSARLNLATFVTTFMEADAGRLMAECADKNMIDKDEYPQTANLEQHCVAILADLWHAPVPSEAVGCPPPAPARRRCWPAWP